MKCGADQAEGAKFCSECGAAVAPAAAAETPAPDPRQPRGIGPWLALVAVAVGVAGLAGAGAWTLVGDRDGAGGDDPSAVVAEFYRRLERFDTAGMLQLVCAEDREAFESGLSLLQAIIGFGNISGVSSGQFALEDFEVRTVDSTADTATVAVAGRLNAGPPVGSTALDDNVDLQREGGGWCIKGEEADDQSASDTVPSPTQELSPTVMPTAQRTAIPTPGARPVGQPTTAAPIEYTVVESDTWYGVAEAFGVDVESLAAYNGLTLADDIGPGDILLIPQ